MYHSKNTRFLHSAIGRKYLGPGKGHGLFTRADIKAGEVLFVERPLLSIEYARSGFLMMLQINADVEERSGRDVEFDAIWNHQLSVSDDIRHQYTLRWRQKGISANEKLEGMSDLVKVNTNRFGKMVWRKPLGVYALLSQVAFGLPQNAAVMFGEKIGCT